VTEPDFRTLAPKGFADAARLFRESGGTPATPRLAATVILLRPSGTDKRAADKRAAGERGTAKGTEPAVEVYAQRRAETMAFAPGVYVFPGGTVDPRDAVDPPGTVDPRDAVDVPDAVETRRAGAEVGWTGPAPEWWGQRLGLAASMARAVVCAAVREVFEECGVLLAGPDESTVVGDVSGPDWEAARVALLARDIALADLLAERGLRVRSDLLAPWARWLTPDFEPRRFDTFFFLARMPVGQRTRDVGGEAVHSVWAPAAELHGLKMLPPTAYNLRELAGFDSIDAAIAASAGRDLTTPVSPYLEFDGDRAWFVVG
jgi:8-oxo-dGTP pyrophosphatase MutT (NUDIX family)